ncbi:pyruvate kinase 2, cytosolic-like isoform X1 [Telopea speciosissima]|uniref:pyruvate kinase 2, cytosolic-like isoform X1 n=1 Tax=Telopea speciosissima TaxID=54955 RepID=UPI001CC3B01F|nr:pyruvate kinase 2, cytosolic-like isoform X1 [Telopea speciosissima]
MQGQMVIEEPVRLASVLTSSKPNFLPSLTKIVGTLGPKSRSVKVIEGCLNAGMSVARFDFSGFDGTYHQETLDNLRTAVENVNKLCAVMLDTVGPELRICNNNGNPIELKVDGHVTITPDVCREPSAEVLPVNYAGLAETVKKGDTIFLGQYLFTGSETTSVWLEVLETKGPDVICLVKNTATLAGFIFTMHVAQVHINLATLTDIDKKVISTWGSHNNVDFISLSYTRHADDVRELRAFLKTQNLHETQIFAKVENVEGLKHFDEILQEADGIILSRGNLGIDLPPEKVFLFQKSAVHKCNISGKPAIITRVVDSMVENLRPTRAEATDVANAVLDGTDGILLGAETLRGLYPIETIQTVGRICFEAECVYNQGLNFKKIVKHVGEPMSHAESVASSAVRAANKVKAAIIVVFTASGRAARLVAKYRPSVPVVAIVIPRLTKNSLNWTFSGTSQARQCLGVRGVYPILASPNVATSGRATEESGLKLALNHGKSVGLVKPNDQIVVFQKIGDSSVVKIVELGD